MLMIFLIAIMILSILILILFFFISKSTNWEDSAGSTFECGFTSYFFSRFSFSMHYFMVGLIFLFLDLELCLIMPFLLEENHSIFLSLYMWLFVLILLMGILLEWSKGCLDWKF